MLHHSGLVASLEWLTGQMKEQFGLHVRLESDGAQQSESTPLKVFLFRAVQELLFNVVKHAGVKTAKVALSSSDGCLSVSVIDQGRGFDPDIINSITSPEGSAVELAGARQLHRGEPFNREHGGKRQQLYPEGSHQPGQGRENRSSGNRLAAFHPGRVSGSRWCRRNPGAVRG